MRPVTVVWGTCNRALIVGFGWLDTSNGSTLLTVAVRTAFYRLSAN